MTLKNKRLIASMITNFCISATIVGFGLGVYCYNEHNMYNKTCDNINNQQLAMYDSVKQTNIFKNEYNNTLQQYTDDYTSNAIDVDTYYQNMEYLNSNQFVEDCIEKYGNDEIKNDLNQLIFEQNALTREANRCKNIGNTCMLACVGSGIISTSSLAYGIHKRKKTFKQKSCVETKIC